jgi:hypothetical protein
MRNLSIIVAVCAGLVICGTVQAAQTTYFAFITHDQEPGGVPNQGSSGFGLFVLNDDNPASPFMTYDIKLNGLDLNGLQTPSDPNDNVTRTHFHAAAFGVNGGIVHGQIDPSPTLQNDPDDLVVNPVLGTIVGVWDGTEGNGTTLATQISLGRFNLDANNRTGLYFNVHSNDFPGGEIRGQLTLPEPSCLALLGLVPVLAGRIIRRSR